jgi:hypothetical protein
MRNKTRTGRNCQYRLDIRGKNGNVDRVKILERQDGAKFVPIDGNFTDEHMVHLELFAKAAAAVAKAAVPPFDADAILRKVNTPRRKKRGSQDPQKKPATPESVDDGEGDWD